MILKILDVVLKSLVSIIVLFLISKLIGKKSIAQLTFFDYIVGITIGSIAGSLSVEKNIDYVDGITALSTWGLFSYAVAYLSIKSIWARRFFDSTPTVLIQSGKIIENNLRKEKININDFLEELRIKGVFNIEDVEFAIFETNGEVSIQLKSQKRPLTPEDMAIPTQYEGLTANLIIDGKIMKENLQLVKLDEKWLTDELLKVNINSVQDVLLASLDTTGKLFISKKEKQDVKGILE